MQQAHPRKPMGHSPQAHINRLAALGAIHHPVTPAVPHDPALADVSTRSQREEQEQQHQQQGAEGAEEDFFATLALPSQEEAPGNVVTDVLLGSQPDGAGAATAIAHSAAGRTSGPTFPTLPFKPSARVVTPPATAATAPGTASRAHLPAPAPCSAAATAPTPAQFSPVSTHLKSAMPAASHQSPGTGAATSPTLSKRYLLLESLQATTVHMHMQPSPHAAATQLLNGRAGTAEAGAPPHMVPLDQLQPMVLPFQSGPQGHQQQPAGAVAAAGVDTQQLPVEQVGTIAGEIGMQPTGETADAGAAVAGRCIRARHAPPSAEDMQAEKRGRLQAAAPSPAAAAGAAPADHGARAGAGAAATAVIARDPAGPEQATAAAAPSGVPLLEGGTSIAAGAVTTQQAQRADLTAAALQLPLQQERAQAPAPGTSGLPHVEEAVMEGHDVRDKEGERGQQSEVQVDAGMQAEGAAAAEEVEGASLPTIPLLPGLLPGPSPTPPPELAVIPDSLEDVGGPAYADHMHVPSLPPSPVARLPSLPLLPSMCAAQTAEYPQQPHTEAGAATTPASGSAVEAQGGQGAVAKLRVERASDATMASRATLLYATSPQHGLTSPAAVGSRTPLVLPGSIETDTDAAAAVGAAAALPALVTASPPELMPGSLQVGAEFHSMLAGAAAGTTSPASRPAAAAATAAAAASPATPAAAPADVPGMAAVRQAMSDFMHLLVRSVQEATAVSATDTEDGAEPPADATARDAGASAAAATTAAAAATEPLPSLQQLGLAWQRLRQAKEEAAAQQEQAIMQDAAARVQQAVDQVQQQLRAAEKATQDEADAVMADLQQRMVQARDRCIHAAEQHASKREAAREEYQQLHGSLQSIKQDESQKLETWRQAAGKVASDFHAAASQQVAEAAQGVQAVTDRQALLWHRLSAALVQDEQA